MTTPAAHLSLDNHVRTIWKRFGDAFVPPETPHVIEYNRDPVLHSGDVAGTGIYYDCVEGGAGAGGYLQVTFKSLNRPVDDGLQTKLRKIADAVKAVFRPDNGEVPLLDFAAVADPEDEPVALPTSLVAINSRFGRGEPWAVKGPDVSEDEQSIAVVLRFRLWEDFAAPGINEINENLLKLRQKIEDLAKA